MGARDPAGAALRPGALLSLLSFPAGTGVGLTLVLFSLTFPTQTFPRRGLFPLAPAPGSHLSLTFTRQFSKPLGAPLVLSIVQTH